MLLKLESQDWIFVMHFDRIGELSVHVWLGILGNSHDSSRTPLKRQALASSPGQSAANRHAFRSMLLLSHLLELTGGIAIPALMSSHALHRDLQATGTCPYQLFSSAISCPKW